MMDRTGEREVATVPGTLEGICPAHIQRYEFARGFVGRRDVCDLACGTGYGAMIFGDSFYVGIDKDEQAVEFARQSYDGPLREFMVGDAEDPPSLISCEVLVSFETIEHLEHPEKFLAWAKDKCELAIISTPVRGACPQSPFHVREYTCGEFKELLGGYWDHVSMFIQKADSEHNRYDIRYPARPEDMGNLIGVCW